MTTGKVEIPGEDDGGDDEEPESGGSNVDMASAASSSSSSIVLRPASKRKRPTRRRQGLFLFVGTSTMCLLVSRRVFSRQSCAVVSNGVVPCDIP